MAGARWPEPWDPSPRPGLTMHSGSAMHTHVHTQCSHQPLLRDVPVISRPLNLTHSTAPPDVRKGLFTGNFKFPQEQGSVILKSPEVNLMRVCPRAALVLQSLAGLDSCSNKLLIWLPRPQQMQNANEEEQEGCRGAGGWDS